MIKAVNKGRIKNYENEIIVNISNINKYKIFKLKSEDKWMNEFQPGI